MMADAENPIPKSEISGKRFIAAIGASILAAAMIGALGYAILGSASSNVRGQAIVVLVYATLVAIMCAFFKPPTRPPIDFRFASSKSLFASIGLMIATVTAAGLFYLLLSPIFGPFPAALRQVVALATDAKRLQGQPAIVWAIAIPRGVLLVPLFEEVLFRGLLLTWLRKYMRDNLAVVVMAALFALEHGSIIVGPYAFLLGVTMGFVRLRTKSTLNTWVMHTLHNLMLLAIGLQMFGRP